jgi:hypothetical protein
MPLSGKNVLFKKNNEIFRQSADGIKLSLIMKAVHLHNQLQNSSVTNHSRL